MYTYRRNIFLTVVGVLCIGAIVASFRIDLPLEKIQLLLEQHTMYGAIILASVMFVTTVIAPLTSLPLVLIASPLLGPFTTGMACFVGWLSGAIVAFLIGRYGGKPFIAYFISLDTLASYEKRISPRISFLAIVLLRLITPVDILSYVLGTFSLVSFRTYVSATMIGIAWFSFAFAYAGNSLIKGNYVLLGGIGVASVLLIVGAGIVVRTMLNKPQ